MNVLFRRGDQTFIDNNVPLNDGQIIFNETDEAIYVDNTINGTVVRKRYGGGNLSRSDIDMAFSTTSENPIANKVVTNAIGTLSNLTTDAKTNLVSAVNEVDAHTNTAIDNANTNASHIGTLSNLTTTAKNNLVSAVNEVDANSKKLKIEFSSFSSLPQTKSDTRITSDMVIDGYELGTPSAQTADWNVSTSNGSVTISGTNAISGSTTLTLWLMRER